jgi:hypothetical protein
MTWRAAPDRKVTLAKTLDQQQALAELPMAGISGEIVWARFGDRPE